MTTNTEAYTDTMGRIKAKWDTTGFPIIYPNVPLDVAAQACVDNGETPYARVAYMTSERGQTSIAGPTNAKYTASGVVMVQIFTLGGDGGQASRTLTALVETAFEGVSVSNGVWYRDVRTETVGPDGVYFHDNVVAEWSYDQVR